MTNSLTFQHLNIADTVECPPDSEVAWSHRIGDVGRFCRSRVQSTGTEAGGGGLCGEKYNVLNTSHTGGYVVIPPKIDFDILLPIVPRRIHFTI